MGYGKHGFLNQLCMTLNPASAAFGKFLKFSKFFSHETLFVHSLSKWLSLFYFVPGTILVSDDKANKIHKSLWNLKSLKLENYTYLIGLCCRLGIL